MHARYADTSWLVDLRLTRPQKLYQSLAAKTNVRSDRRMLQACLCRQDHLMLLSDRRAVSASMRLCTSERYMGLYSHVYTDPRVLWPGAAPIYVY